MRQLIAAMNMTLDGFCDNTTIIAELVDELAKGKKMEKILRTVE
ncbi:MAG: DUF2200 family protein [Pyrinomonadaceae bacterium]